MEKNKKAILGENLRELVYQSGREQKAIARYLGINEKSFSTYCVGKSMPSFETLKKIADYFHTTVESLLSDTDVRTNPENAFSSLFLRLDEDDRENVVMIMKGLLQKKKDIKKESSKLA